VLEIVMRDLAQSSLFHVMEAKEVHANLDAEGLGIDPKAWRADGAEGVVKAQSTLKGGTIHLELRLYMVARGAEPVLKREIEAGPTALHAALHQWDNDVVKAFTGVAASFGTNLVFGSTLGGGVKAIWEIASDGDGLTRLATSAPMAIAPAIGRGGVYYAGVTGDRSGYQLFRIGNPVPVLQQSGQIYGVAFGGGKMAVVVAQGGQSDIYVGNADGTGLAKVTSGGLNTHPSLSPAGQLAYTSNKGGNPQIYVDGRRVSARGTYNMAPTWCAAPDGARVIFMGRDGASWDLFSTDAVGGIDAMQRLTQDQGSNTFPACSPDGRTVAFFSSRDGGGLYTSDLRGQNQRKLAGVTGESLRWEGN
jgi:TolB protein